MSEDLENYIHILDEEYETPEEITVSAIDTVDGVTILPYRLPKINFDMYHSTFTATTPTVLVLRLLDTHLSRLDQLDQTPIYYDAKHDKS